MWFTDNCKKLYLRGWRYNTGRILTELAKIIENNNGTTYSEVYIENLNPETWLFDCLFKSDCSNADIIEVANLIYNQLVSAPLGESVSETIRKRVPNYYNNGYHYELIVKPGREITITF